MQLEQTYLKLPLPSVINFSFSLNLDFFEKQQETHSYSRT